MRPLKILFVTCEYAPLVKVGGLADVSAALPRALAALGHDVRVLLPRIHGLPRGRPVARLPGGDAQAIEEAPRLAVWLLDTPGLRVRENPYARHDGQPHADDAARFAELARAAALIADDGCGLDWRPDVVHCQEWHAALTPLLLLLARIPAASVLTVHNLAYRGLFPLGTADALGLPGWVKHPDAAEFWGQLSFLKAGLVFADRVTTVSPGYAREMLTPAFGEGLDGVLRARGDGVAGILNGLDADLWDGNTDPHLAAPLPAGHPERKREAKAALFRELGWRADAAALAAPLAGVVSRMTAQKGLDRVLDALPALLARGLRLAVLGSGDKALEARWRDAANRHPERIALRIGFDEGLAHRVYAGCDLFLMPSRFEPCGLSQMSAMRYGALPIVNPVGGLADSVTDASPQAIADGVASGFLMASPDAGGLVEALDRALRLWAQPMHWHGVQRLAMARRFDWRESARRYARVYRDALEARGRVLRGVSDA